MVHSQNIITKSAEETAAIGQALSSSIKILKGEGKAHTQVVCLYGDLGSGKTTFAQGFAKGLGIETRLLSPTFIIVRRYDIPERVGFFYHVDLYRVKTQKDTVVLGLADILADPRNYVVMEWAEKATPLLPKKRMDIFFSVLPHGHELRIEEYI